MHFFSLYFGFLCIFVVKNYKIWNFRQILLQMGWQFCNALKTLKNTHKIEKCEERTKPYFEFHPQVLRQIYFMIQILIRIQPIFPIGEISRRYQLLNQECSMTRKWQLICCIQNGVFTKSPSSFKWPLDCITKISQNWSGHQCKQTVCWKCIDCTLIV